MKLIDTLKLLPLVLAISVPAFANVSEKMNQADVAELSEASVPELDVDEMIGVAIDGYFSKRGIMPGEVRKGGKVYYAAKEPVSVSADSPQWSKARQVAFEKALLKIRADFVFDAFGRTVNEAEQSISSDDSSDNREFKEDLAGVGKIEAIWKKLVAGTDAKLNEWLQGHGIDPGEYDSVPPAQRKDLFVNKYVSKTISKAMGDSSGLIPVQTFEGTDDSGTTMIGVVALYSPKLKQLASDIANKRSPILQGKKGKPLSNYIELSPEVLAAQFGIRVVFDEQGSPMVLSYGQWGYSYTGNNKKTQIRHRQTATETANTKALEGLVNFINSQLSFSDTRTTGEAVESYLQKTGDDIIEKDISTLIDKTMKSIKSKSSARMGGTRIVKQWKHKDVSGQEIIGSIRMWSLAGVEAANNIRDFKPQTSTKPKAVEKKDVKHVSGVRVGAPVTSYDEDF